MTSSYHLLQNQPETVVYNNIKSLRDDNQLLDINLICEDGVILSAHKLILAAHSDKFKNILKFWFGETDCAQLANPKE